MKNWQKIVEAVAVSEEMREAEFELWLDDFCDGDTNLKNEIKSLLAFQYESENFLEKTVGEYAAQILPEDEKIEFAGKFFGNYRIIREIGRGGMGAVFLARRADGAFEQQVALKIVRQTLADSELEKRFKKERQILASLNHPNIARLLDGGVSETGEPFLAMEYIEGKPLLKYAEQLDLSLEERLRLFLKICRSVAFAHRNLIVHHDLKPSNILVDKSGEPKLLDFGLAKVLDAGLEIDSTQTETAFRAFTPAYASPEQLRGERAATTASDIYSLGIVLYELLTGRRPFDFNTDSFEEIYRVASTIEPAKPSEAGNRNSKIQNSKELRGDIDNIVMTALRKEPERRYPSVEAFAEDIALFLEGKPIKARPATFRYRTAKFVQRNKIAVAAAILVLLAIVSGLIVALWEAGNARRQRDLAQKESYKAQRISEFLSSALTYSDPAAAAPGAKNRRDATINQMLDDYAPRIETELADQPDIRASLQRTVGLAYFSQSRYAEAERYLNAALETDLKLYGETHRETAATYLGLASVMEAKADFGAAVNFLQKAIAIYRQEPPTEDAHIKNFADALSLMGDIYWTKGDFDAANAAYNESLTLALRLEDGKSGGGGGGGGELIANAKRGLGVTRYGQGRFTEATALLREAIAEYRRLPHLRWKLPDALNFLAQTLMWKSASDGGGSSGEFDEALNYLKESEAICLEIWGENNFWYPRSLWLQAYTLCLKGECAAAEKVLNRAEEINDRYFPENKVTKGNIYDARNLILTRTGRTADGEAFGRRAIELYQTSMNRGTPSVTIAREHLAENLLAQKKYEEAEKLLSETFKDAAEAQGVEHWRTKEVGQRLADVYKILGKPEQPEN